MINRLPFIISMIAIICSIVALSVLVVSASFTSNYNYNRDITFQNTTEDDVKQALTITVNASDLIELDYILPNAADVTMQYLGYEEYLTATNLSGTASKWRTEYVEITGNNSVKKTFWFGDSSAGTRNQSWIADDQDSNYVISSGTSIFDMGTKSFSIECDITLVKTPDSDQIIVGKGKNYELSISGTPCYELTIWTDALVEHSVNITATVGTLTNLLAWYDGTSMVITDYTLQSSGSVSSFLSVSGTPVHILECDALVDNLVISTE